MNVQVIIGIIFGALMLSAPILLAFEGQKPIPGVVSAEEAAKFQEEIEEGLWEQVGDCVECYVPAE